MENAPITHAALTAGVERLPFRLDVPTDSVCVVSQIFGRATLHGSA